MPGDKEVLRYDIDISEPEAKAKRLLELMEEISKARAGGADTSELEQQFQKEFAALEKLVPKEEAAAGATDGLVKQKEKLAAVMRLLRGNLGGLGGDLGGVIELLMKGGTHALGFAGALAGITAGIALYKELRDTIREAVEEQERLNEKVSEQKASAVGREGMLREVLAGLGGSGQFKEAATIMDQLRGQYGFSDAEAAPVAGMAAVADLGAEQAGMLALLAREKGMPATPEMAREAMGDMSPAAAAGLRAELDRVKRGQPEQIRARAAQMGQPTGAQMTSVEMLYRQLEEGGELGAGVLEGVGSAEDLRKKLDEGRELLERNERFQASMDRWMERWGADEPQAGRQREQDERMREAAPYQRLLNRLAQPAAMPEDRARDPAVTQQITIYDNRINAGTIHNAPSRRTVFGPSGISVNIGGQNYLRSGNGF